jgi:hypothetical protein
MKCPKYTRSALASCLALVLYAGLAALPRPAGAQGFGASISPPRFELEIAPGQTRREVIDIQQVGLQSGSFRIYTNDWTFQPDGDLAFSNDVAAGSCRHWVALERRELTVAGNARYRFRFEITPPADTPAGECRFAIMIEGTDPARVEQAGLNIPVGGRIAVIVYAAVGGAEPRLEIGAMRVLTANGQTTPAIEVRNSGNAHGRLDGFLDGVDASGQKFELSPADVPILPGESRTISIMPVSEEAKGPPAIKFPIKVKGTLEWGKNRIPLEHTFVR